MKEIPTFTRDVSTIENIKAWLIFIDQFELPESIKSIEHLDTTDLFKHSEEQLLHLRVFKLIADGKCPDPQEYASLALSSSNLIFKRFHPGYTMEQINNQSKVNDGQD